VQKGRDRVVFIHRCNSPLGGITAASYGTAFTGLCFESQKHFPVLTPGGYEEKPLPVFTLTDKWLDIYFGGRAPGFTPPLGIKSTPFRAEVYDILLTVPFGQTVTYGEIADTIANRHGLSRMSAQAVGSAVSRNPVSLIIPCHRVIGADGSLTGYAGGLCRKAKLLELEREGFPLIRGDGKKA
jgi:methylated-DNA-[protein]-cysteine S-methyltransferase